MFVAIRLSQTLPHGVICVLPVVVNYSSLGRISPHRSLWSWDFFCRSSGCLEVELPERQTAWTVVNCEQFQTVT